MGGESRSRNDCEVVRSGGYCCIGEGDVGVNGGSGDRPPFESIGEPSFFRNKPNANETAIRDPILLRLAFVGGGIKLIAPPAPPIVLPLGSIPGRGGNGGISAELLNDGVLGVIIDERDWLDSSPSLYSATAAESPDITSSSPSSPANEADDGIPAPKEGDGIRPDPSLEFRRRPVKLSSHRLQTLCALSPSRETRPFEQSAQTNPPHFLQ